MKSLLTLLALAHLISCPIAVGKPPAPAAEGPVAEIGANDEVPPMLMEYGERLMIPMLEACSKVQARKPFRVKLQYRINPGSWIDNVKVISSNADDQTNQQLIKAVQNLSPIPPYPSKLSTPFPGTITIDSSHFGKALGAPPAPVPVANTNKNSRGRHNFNSRYFRFIWSVDP